MASPSSHNIEFTHSLYSYKIYMDFLLDVTQVDSTDDGYNIDTVSICSL